MTTTNPSTSSTDDDLAIRLTSRIIAVEGVRGLFPHSVVAAAVTTFIRSDQPGATGLVSVDHDAVPTTITARIAIDSQTPTVQVAHAVTTAVTQFLDPEPFRLHLEVAHLV